MHKKRAHFLFHALPRSPTKGPNRIHGERECAPVGRISTHMSFDFEMFGRISRERLVSVDAKLSLSTPLEGAARRDASPYRFGGGFIETTLPGV